MIVRPSAKAILLRLRNPERVTSVIATAKQITYQGLDIVAVPHRLDETRVLRNLGHEVPSPIEYHYKWSGQYTPFAAQRTTAAFLTLNNRAFVLNDLGTGKTLASLWAYDYLRSTGQAKKLLVISPLSTLERTWADEIFRHFPHLTWGVLHGTKDRRVKVLAQDVDVYLVNHDGIKVLEKHLADREDIDTVIIDEIASFRNASTERWRSLHRVIEQRKRVWGLTGTPTPNVPTDAWAQCRLISPDRVPKYSYAFRDLTMRQLSQFKWVPKDNATEIVAEAMQPSIRFTRDECIDLPPCIYQTRHVEMSPEQTKAYTEMLGTLFTEYQGGEVHAVNEAVKLQKLIQIASGVVYGTDGSRVYLPSDARIEVTREIIEEAGTKTIVFVPYRASLEFVANALSKHFTVEIVNGEVSKTKRDDIFDRFQNTPDPRVLVAQPAAMSHGLTLTAANTIVWFAPITSQEVYTQANARVSRPGQKYSQLIVNIEGSTAERRVYARLKDKERMEGLLLDIIKGQKRP